MIDLVDVMAALHTCYYQRRLVVVVLDQCPWTHSYSQCPTFPKSWCQFLACFVYSLLLQAVQGAFLHFDCLHETTRFVYWLRNDCQSYHPQRQQSHHLFRYARQLPQHSPRHHYTDSSNPLVVPHWQNRAAVLATLSPARPQDVGPPEGAIRREIASIDRTTASLNEEVGNIDGRLALLTASIAETPQIEIALIGLQRRPANISVQYQDAVRKEAAAADGEELEINSQAERFRVLEPAQVPEAPDWPPRKLIAIGGAGGSVALGALLMLGAELRNQSVRTAGQIERRLDLRPLVTIPMVRTQRDTRRRFLILAAVIVLMIATIAAILFIIDRYYLPIDLLLRSLMDRTGLSALISGGG